MRNTALFSPAAEIIGDGGGKEKGRSTMTNTKDAVFILTFCSFFSDILSPCLANCQECGEGEKQKKKVRDKNNTVHTAKAKDVCTTIVNEHSNLTFRQSPSITYSPDHINYNEAKAPLYGEE